MSGHSQNANLPKDRLDPVWKCLRQAILAVDRLARALNVAAADSGLPAPHVVQKRQGANRHEREPQAFRFADEDIKLIIQGLFEQSGEIEITLRPPELLQIARSVQALPSKIAAEEPAEDGRKRSERAALARHLGAHNHRTFAVEIGDTEQRIYFEAIGEGHSRRYRFAKCTN